MNDLISKADYCLNYDPGKTSDEFVYDSPAASDAILLVRISECSPKRSIISAVRWENHELTLENAEYAFIDVSKDFRPLYGIPVHLKKGSNRFSVSYHSNWDRAEKIIFSIIPPPEKKKKKRVTSGTIPIPEIRADEIFAKQKSLHGFQKGCGGTGKPGRFGFLRGDGLLDCGIPFLGEIDKRYICGNPQYHRHHRWLFRTLPYDGIIHGSFPPSQPIDDDRIEINPLSVSWETKFESGSFRMRYSLASPGVVTESDAGYMRLSGLEFASEYSQVMLCEKGSIHVYPVEKLTSADLSSNWIMLSGSDTFPNIPLQIVLDKHPEKIELKYHASTGKLSEIIFHGCSRMITLTPLGIENLQSGDTDRKTTWKRLAERAVFWGRAVLDFPVECQEYFRIGKNRIDVVEKYQYVTYRDEWDTSPLRLAPIPPILSFYPSRPRKIIDFQFPTKYGYLKGFSGDTAEYSLRIPKMERKFPFPGKKEDPELAEDFRKYFDFVQSIPDYLISYPFAGAVLEPYAMASSLNLFYPRSDREKMDHELKERMDRTADGDRKDSYAIVNWSQLMKMEPTDEEIRRIYQELKLGTIDIYHCYEHEEPFTKVWYEICYLNVFLFSCRVIKTGSKEEVKALKIPLIENDWGCGLTFYYLYLAGIATGDFSAVRKNYDHLKRLFRYFILMNDWACMSSAGCDNGTWWDEGANFGAFTAMAHFAKLCNDAEMYELVMYLTARLLCGRVARVLSAHTYFCRYIGCGKWYGLHTLSEEGQIDVGNIVAPPKGDSTFPDIYNLTTEGFYPEVFENLNDLVPATMRKFCRIFAKKIYRPVPGGESPYFFKEQATCAMISEALDPQVSDEQFAADLAHAKKHDHLVREWRGIPVFSRRLPACYWEKQIKLWQKLKQQKIWLEFLNGVSLKQACLDKNVLTLDCVIEKEGKLQLGTQFQEIEFTHETGKKEKIPVSGGKAVLSLKKSEKLRLKFSDCQDTFLSKKILNRGNRIC